MHSLKRRVFRVPMQLLKQKKGVTYFCKLSLRFQVEKQGQVKKTKYISNMLFIILMYCLQLQYTIITLTIPRTAK